MGRHRKPYHSHRKPRRAPHRLSRIAILSAGLVIPVAGGAAVFAASGRHEERAAPSAGAYHTSRHGAKAVNGAAAPPRTAVSRPSTTPTPAGSPSASTASPAPDAPKITFAPYADVLTWPPLDFARTAERTGVRDYTLGFVTSDDGCAVAWGGLSTIDDPHVRERIGAVPGKITVSFGGPAGTEPARACDDTDDLTARYRSVLAATHTDRVDFYLTDAALADAPSVRRRAEALARLRHGRPGLEVSFTLPVRRSGLSAAALAALRSTMAAGLDVSLVNLVPAGVDVRSLTTSADTAHAQLAHLYRADAAGTWRRMGVTPVIGVTGPDTGFAPDDARELLGWARGRGVGRLSMWSITRDAPCTGDTTVRTDTCSGLDEDAGAFSKIFNGSSG